VYFVAVTSAMSTSWFN